MTNAEGYDIVKAYIKNGGRNMEQKRSIQPGQVYKHFKGHIIKIMAIAEHTETKETLVIYEHQGSHKVWARPLDMFLSKVDHEKYPEVTQTYRFELEEEG